MQAAHNIIWTIGHSTRTMEEFIQMLQSFSITQVADVRHFPGSRKFPHFNKEELGRALATANIRYEHIESLGGRRKPKSNSKNIAWRHPAFRGYADYMETPPFREGIHILEQLGAETRTAYMCSEAVWWRCHRSLISDYLKAKGWTVQHIMDVGKAKEHPFTAPAKVVNGHLSYMQDE
ncbi:DUF488 family protein [Flavisolibacter ginsenosidimutans]|uniref:DUF488 domain-containing protein n=1 Tax=Flavisolibacter ginsenosidimutans TaxID=661481 RepID=A0A5B8UJ56_9BACT|nr:DUF488 domain-containing protein [Flavisolibacter ginsenosidimutans]QEC56130.1 DUF488 domain-containing protein [Flavisolibacter ginsenosidimutans]